MNQSILFGSLQVEITHDDQRSVYKFSGDVDETFDQLKIPGPLRPVMVLDLAQIKHFNSVGIREWILFVRRLRKLESLIFKECSVGVIDQINMVPDSLGDGKVESFYAPYYCNCGKESNRLIQVHQHQQNLQLMEAPEFKCECGQSLEFDAIEESYFQFIQHLPKVG